MITYRVEEMAVLTGFKPGIEFGSHAHNMGDNIYNAYDFINRQCAMTYKQWCVVRKSGCDVT